MELQKQEYRILRQKSSAESQITMDEEFNVPDARPDVGRMIQKKGSVQIRKVNVSDDRVMLSGEIQFCLLYVADDENRGISSLEGQLPIEETMRLDGVRDGDKIRLNWDVEDLAIRLIHPRKLNIQAMVSFVADVQEQKTLLLPVGAEGADSMSFYMKEKNILGICVHRKDTLRLREEIVLPANKQDVEKILWQDIQVRGLKLRCGEGEILYKGEMFVFLLYAGEDPSSPPEWIEEIVPVSGSLDCEKCETDMLPNIEVRMAQSQITVKPDANGEERMLTAEAVMDVDLRLEKERHFSILMDAYDPTRECTPVSREEAAEYLMIKNEAKCRIGDRQSTGEAQGKILQVCHSDGSVRVDECRIVPGGLEEEGILQVRILYIVSDDNMPFYAMEAVMPFLQRIEVPGMHEQVRYELHTDLEQLSTTMADSHEIEIKATINCSALVLGRQTLELLQDIRIKPLDPAKIRDLPGIVCCRIQPGDTLWELAKKYYTTVEDIRMLNGLETDPKVGQTVVLVKKVES